MYHSNLPEIAREIVDELDAADDAKRLHCVQDALIAYERKWLLRRINADFETKSHINRANWKENFA